MMRATSSGDHRRDPVARNREGEDLEAAGYAQSASLRIEADLFGRLAKGSGYRIGVTRISGSTGEADLAGVRTQMRDAGRQKDASLALGVGEEQHENGRWPAAPRRDGFGGAARGGCGRPGLGRVESNRRQDRRRRRQFAWQDLDPLADEFESHAGQPPSSARSWAMPATTDGIGVSPLASSHDHD